MRRLLLCLLLLLPTLNLPAAEEADPPALTEYKGRTIARTMHWTGAEWLMRANREQEENAALMIKELRIQPGWNICDLGCGSGYHALTMSTLTGEKGKILAVDIQQEMLDMLNARAAGRGLKNIQPILGTYHDPKLPPASCDLILLVDVYHEFSHPEHQLKAMHAALKPEGRIALVEYRAEDNKVPIKPEHKMSKEQIRREWLPMGFEVDREFDGLPWQHLIFFKKKAVP
ncbi:MAG: Methyltransferase type 11 [Verrucomicrobiales bacterium]|nr:Methyltransferase type 11 [Verrucomicrobiales bacterium]